MNKRNSRGKPMEEARVALLGLWPDEEAALIRSLAGHARVRWLRLVPSSRLASDLGVRALDALLCDLAGFFALAENWQAQEETDWPAPTLVLVALGEEERAAAVLESAPVEFLLRAGGYRSWLGPWVRRALRRRTLYWEEVAAIVRHEINNPLTGVLGNAELLLADCAGLSERDRQRLLTIIQLAVRLRDVVRNLEARLERQRARWPDADAPQPVAGAQLPGQMAR
ncbi:MAG: hypothetical protein HYY26_02240 [Acidobacteria bacterium]|nr:hypothetical protein [Acidobacteriota bacterium]